MKLDDLGLISLGRFDCIEQDNLGAGSIEIIANAGSPMFEPFSRSPEAANGHVNPLNLWTKRVISEQLHPEQSALFPFEGPPYHPFQRWAQRADPDLHPSPIGLLIHGKYGLWLALRAAILHPDPLGETSETRTSPCQSCPGKPCLHACPAGAFTGHSYDHSACAAHIQNQDLKSCMSLGCAARHACPIGKAYAYEPDHARFHMEAFHANFPRIKSADRPV